MFGFVWQDPNHEEYGTMQAAYDEDTEDLALDIAVWVDYEGDNDYCYRNDIEGNAGTNYFNFRSVKGNRVAESAFTSMRGAGFSRGEGEFFLLRIANNAAPEGLYYCIGAEDGETQLMAMAAEGSQDVEESCEEFREAVDSMTMLDTDDLACRETDFNPGGRHEGSVLLEF